MSMRRSIGQRVEQLRLPQKKADRSGLLIALRVSMPGSSISRGRIAVNQANWSIAQVVQSLAADSGTIRQTQTLWHFYPPMIYWY